MKESANEKSSLFMKLKMLPMWFRGLYYKRHFELCGNHLIVYRGFDLYKSKAKVKVGDNVRFYSNVKISVLGMGGAEKHIAKLIIGNNVAIGTGSQIHCGQEVLIGNGTLISWNCCIMDRDYHKFNGDSEIMLPVHIGANVWIGHNVIINKGVSIGDGAVIATGSVVTKDVASSVCDGGNPAKIFRQNVVWYP